MATSYPGAIDAFDNPDLNTPENAAGFEHDLQHVDLNDAVEAIQTELGTNPSGAYSTVGDRIFAIENKSLTFPVTKTWAANGYTGIINEIGTILGISYSAPWGYMNPCTTTTWGNAAMPPGPVDLTGRYRVTTSQSSTYSSALYSSYRALDHVITAGGTLASGGEVHTTNATANEWWEIDFGSGRSLTPTYVGIYGRISDVHQPRNFKIQGSNNDSTWSDLLTVSAAGPSNGTWWSSAVVGASGYRYIRIYQTGLNSSSDNYLTLGDVEFWGTLA